MTSMNISVFSLINDNRVHAYKTIVALNNMGVSLLARNNCTDAADTFKDAIRLMKSSFYQGQSIPPQEDFKRALHHAQVRTFKMAAGSSLERPVASVVSDQVNPLQLHKMLVQNPKESICIRIDPTDCYHLNDIERLDTESAILLYNYGMAYRCAIENINTTTSSVSTTKTNNENYRNAIQVFDIAQTLASKLFSTDSVMPISSQVILISLLSTTVLLDLSCSINAWEMHSRYSEDLYDILETLFEQFPEDSFDAAAAA